MSTEDEMAKLFRVWKTLLEMLRDRGFLVLESEIKTNMREFMDKYGENFKRENLEFCKAKVDDPNDQIFVFFPNEPKLNIKILKRCTERMKAENALRAIIVSKDSPTPFAKRALQDVSNKYYLDLFMESELLVNVNNHMLVPKHEVLSKEEKESLLQRYTVKETQLPKMQLHDPIARYFGLRRGQVVKITRDSETAGKYVTYRFIV